MKIKYLLFVFPILAVLLLLIGCLSLWFPDRYYEKIFREEIDKDVRLEKLLFINSNYPSRPDDDAFIVGVELKNGKHITGEAENSIYNFHKIMEIDNFRIYTVTIYFDGRYSQWNSIYSNGIRTNTILWMFNNHSVSSEKLLDQILDNYSKIGELLYKIYEEGTIPLGIEEGRNIDISEWGDEEELQIYTGYINWSNNTVKMKIYVEKLELKNQMSLNESVEKPYFYYFVNS